MANCWYCHLSGHIQKDCRKRIARGAAIVKKPRSVSEVELDAYEYQEADYDDDEQDDYLSQSLAAIDEDQDDQDEEDLINQLDINMIQASLNHSLN